MRNNSKTEIHSATPLVPSQLTLALDYYYAQCLAGHALAPWLLESQPGVGKTDIVFQVSAKHGVTLVDLRVHESDPTDLGGSVIPVGEEQQRLRPWWLTKLWDTHAAGGRPGLFLDEIGLAPESIQAVAMQIVNERRVGPHKLPPNTVILGATNRVIDRTGVKRMASALRNRLTFISLVPSLKDWLTYHYQRGTDERLTGFVSWCPDIFDNFDAQAQEAQATPRSVSRCEPLLDAPESVRHELLEGTVGRATAAYLTGFLRVWEDLPDLDTLLIDPQGARVPEKSDARYATVAAITAKANGSTIDAISTYLRRLDGDLISVGIAALANRPNAKEYERNKGYRNLVREFHAEYLVD